MSVAVVHTDSPEGRAALAVAAREAADRHERLVVLHVLDDDGAVALAQQDAVRASVRSAIGDVLGDDGWDLCTEVHDGDPIGTVIDLVERSGAGRVVAGSRGKNAVGKFLLERTLQRLLVEVPVPVLVVKTPA